MDTRTPRGSGGGIVVGVGGGGPGLIAGKYQIERLIGRGGMAEVFAATNVRTGKRVALKKINPTLAATAEARARFRREALAAGRVNHPNVVTVFDVVEHQGSTCLVMELLEGETLSELLLRTKSLPPDVAIAVLIPALRGVAAAHAHGVVHRDLKPDNIFLCRVGDGQRGEAKVLDFGVSKLATEGVDDVNITGTGGLVGTPIYMAPEQVRGGKDIDHRTDVYTLGVVLYQMLAGRPPYMGDVYSALMVQIATTEPPRLRTLRPDIPPALEKIVHRGMARELDQRYQDVNSFIRALEGFLRGEQVEPGSGARAQAPAQAQVPPSTTEKTTRLTLPTAKWRKPWVVPTAIGLGMVVVGFVIKVVIDSVYPVAPPPKTVRTESPVRIAPSPAPIPAAKPPSEQPQPPTPDPAMAGQSPTNGPSGSAAKPAEAVPAEPSAAPAYPPAPSVTATVRPSSHRPTAKAKNIAEGPTRAVREDKAKTDSGKSPPAAPGAKPADTNRPSRAGRITIDDF